MVGEQLNGYCQVYCVDDHFMYSCTSGGNLCILVSSHIGISDSHKLGYFSRAGQQTDGSACGAAIGAWKHCCNPSAALPTAESLGSDPSDYQMQFIISEIAKRIDVINAHEDENNRNAELAKQMYHIAKVIQSKFEN
jgi:hypothetical protein